MSTDSPITRQTTAAPTAREFLSIVLILGAVLLLVLPLGLLWALATWTAGAGLLWTSKVWSPREKALGTLVWPGGLIGPTLLATSFTQVCSYVSTGGSGTTEVVSEPVCTGFALSPWIGLPLTLLAFGAPIVTGALLLTRSTAR